MYHKKIEHELDSTLLFCQSDDMLYLFKRLVENSISNIKKLWQIIFNLSKILFIFEKNLVKHKESIFLFVKISYNII